MVESRWHGPNRFREPVAVAIATQRSIDDARLSLAGALGQPELFRLVGDRRLAGSVSPDGRVVTEIDAPLPQRRRNWNVQFRGRLEATGSGARLSGTLAVPTAKLIRLFLGLFMLVGLGLTVAGIAMAISSLIAGTQWFDALFALAIGLVTVAATQYMRVSGERWAAVDAQWIVDRLTTTLQ